MESCDFVDSVMTEKANAIARYRRFTNITKLFQLIEIFVGVALISWSSTHIPFVFKLSGEYLLAFSSYLMNQHVVFLVGNVIVVVCYVLSRYTEAGNESVGYGIHHDEGKHSQLNHQKTTSFVSNPKPPPPPPPQAAELSAATEIQNRMISVEKSVIKKLPEATAETAIKQAAKQIERFQRTQSDKLKSQISMKPRRELQRSVTEKRRSGSTAITSGDNDSTAKMTSFQAVERLSNEEFRIAVETFISKQQSFLKQQNMVEDDN